MHSLPNNDASLHKKFNMGAMLILFVLLLILIILAANEGIDNGKACCNTASSEKANSSIKTAAIKSTVAIENTATIKNTVAKQNDVWPGCEAVLSASYLGFESGSNQLSAQGENMLGKLTPCLSEDKFLIVGHTDDVGQALDNASLSLQRAASVRIFLIKEGVNASRLSIEGLGESEPIADNATAKGRAKNRRIEFIKK